MGNPRSDVDLVVVGGSFAGLVLARTAALRGLRTVVLERRATAGSRVHTTGILVKEAADALDVPARLTRKVRGVRLYSPSLAQVDLHSPGYWFLATDTPGLLEWLTAEAERAGASIRHATPFHGAVREGGRIVIPGAGLRTRFLVGADGGRSRVARCFALSQNTRWLVGVEAEFEGGDRVPPGYLHCFINRHLAPGYIAWAVPGVGVTQVGLARRWPGRPDLSALLERIATVANLRNERPVGWRAGTIPVGGPLPRISAPGVLLVGDAAGWVSPLTAGGIANAFRLGRIAAHRICEHLADGAPDPGPLLQQAVPGYLLKRGLRRVLEGAAWTAADSKPPWRVLQASESAEPGIMDRAHDTAAEWILGSATGRAVARQIFFHARNAHGAGEREHGIMSGVPGT
jgi:flavin-dependent dehydrogenase